jgi:nitrite reductase/ring-hydroxylating ferredoxin subunit
MLTATGLRRSKLGAHGRKLVRSGGKQILVLAEQGRLFAIANRCPHEGYPLSEGTLGPACVLTCNWHNWKFDLASGEALVGRDPVRTYEIAERGGEIFIDVSDPPGDALRARALKGIAAAISDNDRPRMARKLPGWNMPGSRRRKPWSMLSG